MPRQPAANPDGMPAAPRGMIAAAVQRWQRRRSTRARHMTIRRQLAWPSRLLAGIVCLGVIGGIAAATYYLGRTAAMPYTIAGTTGPHGSTGPVLVADVIEDQVNRRVAVSESEINIERAAQRELAAQVKTLGLENAKLKEDLAFFESLLPTTKTISSVAITRLTADIAGPNQVRYRLLVMQGGKADREFNGTVQLAVTVLRAGKSAIISFPEANSHDPVDTEKFHLAFKRYQRIEGLVTLPDGVEIKSVQARILEKGQLQAQQTTIVERNSDVQQKK